jgi:predicted Zn-dependent protease
MLTKEQAEQLTAKVLKFAGFPDCSVTISEEEVAYLRFANNGLTTSGLTLTHTVKITSVRDGKSGVSSTTDLSDESLKATVRRSEELAGFAPPNPEYMEPIGPQKYADYENWDKPSAQARAAQMIPQVKSVIAGAVAKRLVAAGYFERSARLTAFENKLAIPDTSVRRIRP